MFKLKLAEKFSDIDSSNDSFGAKRLKRQIHAKRLHNEEDDHHSDNKQQLNKNMYTDKYPAFPTIHDEIMDSLNSNGIIFCKI